MTIALDWQPQRLVWAGLASASVAAFCLAIAIVTHRGRRRAGNLVG